MRCKRHWGYLGISNCDALNAQHCVRQTAQRKTRLYQHPKNHRAVAPVLPVGTLVKQYSSRLPCVKVRFQGCLVNAQRSSDEHAGHFLPTSPGRYIVYPTKKHPRPTGSLT